MQLDEKYIQECIELARTAEGRVSPNPLVGAIVLDKNGEVVAKGYHAKCGEAHAEVCALNEAGEKAIGGTLYINLEPCAHFGKTPPCADRVAKSGIKSLVIGMIDPNPRVAGKGIEKVKEAGIEVITGVLEKECKKLNEIFIKHITQKKPFIAIKTASTIDGKIATKTGSSKWITGSAARKEVQRLRNKYDAILTGSGTVICDDPSLTCRMSGGRNPVRVVIDSQLKTSPYSKVYNNDGTRIIIAVSEEIQEEKIRNYPQNIEFIKCPVLTCHPETSLGSQQQEILNLTQDDNKKIDLNYLINKLYQSGIMSILVEAGGQLNGTFIKNELIDKFYFFIAPKILGDKEALSSIEGFNVEDINQSMNLRFDEIKSFPPDILIEAYKI